MATALLEAPPWSKPASAPKRLQPALAPVAVPLPPLEVDVAVPKTPASPTKFLTFCCLLLSAMTFALYGHTVQVEGEANRERTEIRKLKEGNHFLQVKLAQATNLKRVESEATTTLNMLPVEGGVFMALPDEVAEMANTVILPGREPTPVPVLPGI